MLENKIKGGWKSTGRKPISYLPEIRIIREDYDIPQVKQEKRISVLLPFSYKSSSKRYPVFIYNDGQNLFDGGGPFG